MTRDTKRAAATGDPTVRFPFRKRHPFLAIAMPMLGVVILLVAGYLVWARFLAPVYVTNGSHPFNGNLAAVEAKVKHENDWVAGSGQPYVSVAVLATMTPVAGAEPLDKARTRHAIEGAFLAQYETNHQNGPSGRPVLPLVRLLLADEGSREKDWSQAADEILRRVDSDDHLVAVSGLGISVDNTKRLVSRLNSGSRPVGMVSAVITGDELGNMPGLVRVSPTNTDEASAAVHFLDDSPELAKALPASPRVLLVQDQYRADGYAKSLGQQFTRAVGGAAGRTRRPYRLVSPGIVYDSSLPDAPTVLAGVGDTVCNSGADIVYFAGRGIDLLGFLHGAASRHCTDRPLTVITGSDATQLANQPDLWSGTPNMSLYYTALAHPDVWSAEHAAAFDQTVVEWFRKPTVGFRAVFPTESLGDGWGIMFHDSVLTASAAVRKLYVQTTAVPSSGAVAQELYHVTVHGASGYICFDAEHNPRNKAIPLIRVDQDGRLHYVALSSASGTPPSGDTCDQPTGG